MITSTAIIIIIVIIIITKTAITITTSTTITVKQNNDNSNNNKNKKNNNNTNEKAVYNKKLQVELEEIRKEKHTNFLNLLKTYEEQADQTDLPQRNKSNGYINSAQINSKVTDVK